MLFNNPRKKFINKIKKRVEIVEKENGNDSIPFCVLLCVYLATQFEEKPKQLSSFIEIYSYFISLGYSSLLDFYTSEILKQNNLSFEEQRLLESEQIFDIYSRPRDFIKGSFIKTGAACFEAYSDLRNTEIEITERFEYYASIKTSNELKTDIFIFNLENSKKNNQIQNFKTNLLEFSNIGIDRKVNGYNSIIAYNQLIDSIKKKMTLSYSIYYKNMDVRNK